MRRTPFVLSLCVALWNVPVGFAADLIDLRPRVLPEDCNPVRMQTSQYGISKFNPLRPRPVASLAAPEKAQPGDKKLAADEPVEIKKIDIDPKNESQSGQAVATSSIKRLPPVDVRPKPTVSLDAFDDIDLIARGIVTPDASVLVPDRLAEIVNQPQHSLFEAISEQSLLDQRTNIRASLHQLLAGTIKNNKGFRAYNYQVVQPKAWFGEYMQRFDWDAVPGNRPTETLDKKSNDNTYRISLNYSQVPNTFDAEQKSARSIIRADMTASNRQVVEALQHQLDAVATEYWNVVARRGQLVAAMDQFTSCNKALAKLEAVSDVVPNNVVGLARTRFDRSAEIRSDAIAALENAQSRLANLVGDPMLQDAEILPQELPAGVVSSAVEHEVVIANKNRAEAKRSPEGVAMEVTLAHKRLGYALEESNRSYRAIHRMKASFDSATYDTVGAVDKLTMALEWQDRLRESTTQFLNALVHQQRSLLDMKRAKGTLARTEVFRAAAETPVLTASRINNPVCVSSGRPRTASTRPVESVNSQNSFASRTPPVPNVARSARQVATPVRGKTSRERKSVVSKWSAAKSWFSKLTENHQPSRR